MTPDELLTHVQKLGESLTRENRNIELVLSEIITRNDEKTLADKVNEYKRGLAQSCIEQNWCLIRHNNINVNHLNNYGLHLNKQGTSVLANNIKQFLNRNRLGNDNNNGLRYCDSNIVDKDISDSPAHGTSKSKNPFSN
jgi:hypothetical protein